uniref:G-protein coupled receptors family 3 profile domain-containing protein n=1 Tax=Bubo bubo TaxID=30461 RepID=A0A8C0FQ05_BUBBB
MLQATKGDGEILLQDISAAAPSLGNLSWDNEWFNALKSQRTPLLRKRLLSNDLRSMETPKWQRGDSYVGDPDHVRWSPPFLECRDGKFLPTWAVTLSSAFYGLKPDLSPEFNRAGCPLDEGIELAPSRARARLCLIVNFAGCDSPGGRGGISLPWLHPLRALAEAPGCTLTPLSLQRIRASGVVLLETILFGSLLLYFPVFILYFKPSIFRCIVLRWVRMLGFAIVYGTITLKLYRVLKVFLSRTAQRVPYVSSGRVLKMLGLILLLVLWFLAAWTIGMLENIDKNIPLVIRTQTARGLHFYICGHDRWDYMMVIAEMLFLLWGSFLCYATRAVPSAFHEPRYMGIALHNELMISAAFHVDGAEVQQPHAEPIPGSPDPSSTGVQRTAAEKPGAAVRPRGAPGIPAGRGALLRQGAVSSREDTGVPPSEESPATALEKGGSQPEPLGPGENQDTERVSPRSRSAETAPVAAGKAGRAVGRQAELCSGETQADSSIKTEICPREESGGEHWGQGRAPGKGGSEEDPGRPREELGAEKPRAKTPELLQGTGEKAESVEGRRAEVCLWDTGEGGRTLRAEICPWDGERAQQQQEKEEGERRQLPKQDKNIRPNSVGLLRAQESRSSLQAPSQPWGSASSKEPPPKPAPKSFELPEVTWRSPRALVCPWEVAGADSDAQVCPWERGTLPDAGKLDDGKISQVKKGISLQRAAPRGTGETAPAADKGSSQRGSLRPREGAEQPSRGLAAKLPALPRASSKQAGTTDSKKADISPWEVGHAPLAKTEICPWEEPATPSGKERPSQDTCGTSEGENKPGSRGPEDIKANLAEMGGSQSEHRDARIFEKLIEKSLESSKAEAKKPENVESIKVCPQESLGTELPPEKPRAGSPALPKSPSKKSQSPESLKAEVCPWELETTDKAEICPWEAAASPSMKEKSRQDKDASSIVTKSPSTGQGLRKKIIDSMSGKKEKASRDPESIWPWKKKPRSGSPALPKSPSSKSQSTESLKAEVCPWEAQELESTNKAEICPWEAAAAPSDQQKAKQGPGGGSKGDKRITRQAALASPVRSLEKGSSEREAVCPQESLGTELPPEKPRAGSPALPKSPSTKSQSAESLKAEVCPWELETTDKAEICPWEAAASPSTKEKSRQDKDASSIVSKSPSTGQGLRKKIVDSLSGKKEKASRDPESICPRDSLGTEQPPEKPRSGSPALPKSPSSKSQSAESLKAEVCPWEAQELESTNKAEICPWEAAAAPSDQQKAKQGPGGGSKGDKRITRQAALASPVRSLEKGSSEREAVCPQESLGTELPPEKPRAGSPALPKSPSTKSQSAESLKAEVCPWELETTDKAEICPWEAAASPSTEEKSRQDKDASSIVSKSPSTGQGLRKKIVDSLSGKKEKASRDPESICPQDSLGTEQPPEKPRSGSPALPKSPSSKSQSAESLKAEVCPWEAQELESTNKAEICPWEAAAAPSDQQKAKQGPGGGSKGDKRITRQAALASPVRSLEKGSSEREAVCPQESLGTELPPEKPRAGSPALPKSPSKKSQSPESLKAEVCPWELETTDKAEICPWEAAASPSMEEKSRQDKDASSIVSKSPSTGQGLRKKIVDSLSGKKEKASRDPESICPQDSLGTEQPPEKPRSGSPALPKSPSSKSQSAQELESTNKAEICPWEAAIIDSMSGKKEKASRDPESICPRDSLGTEQPPEKPRSGSPALPKSPSSKSQSPESLKAEVCPWEAQDVDSSDKAEICLWEVAAPLLVKGAATGKASLPPKKVGASNAPDQGSSGHKAICSWESPGMEELSLKAATGKEPSKKSDICPWEVAEPTILTKESGKPGMHPLGADGASPATPGKSKVAAGASPVSATALLKESKGGSDCKAEHKPLCRILPGTEHWWGPRAEPQGASTAPAAGSGPSPSATVAEVCPWEAEKAPPASDKTSIDPRKTSEVCPWEVQSVDLTPTLRGQGRAGASPHDGGRGGTETKPNICPWVHE